VHDFPRWTDDELDRWLREQAASRGLEFVAEKRPNLEESASDIWFAALRDTGGLALVGAEALSERWAKNGLAQVLDALTEADWQRLVR
jgi:hypothetical protein